LHSSRNFGVAFGGRRRIPRPTHDGARFGRGARSDGRRNIARLADGLLRVACKTERRVGSACGAGADVPADGASEVSCDRSPDRPADGAAHGSADCSADDPADRSPQAAPGQLRVRRRSEHQQRGSRRAGEQKSGRHVILLTR
jgi:hypothetical protein